MASRFSISGWRTSTIAPKMVTQPAIPAATPLPNIATAGYTAGNLVRTPGRLNDPTLASRMFGSTVPGTVKPVAVSSVYQQPNVPAYLTQAVADLNSGQSLQRSLQSEWQNKIFSAANDPNNPNSYLFQEALRAAAVSPGSHVNFGSAVQSPLIGQGYQAAAASQASLAKAQAGAIGAPQQFQAQIAALQREQQLLGQSAFGQFQGSRQQQIQNQLFNLQNQLTGSQTVAAGNNRASGWMPAPLPY